MVTNNDLDFPSYQKYKEDVKKFMDTLRQEERYDEECFKEQHKIIALQAIEEAFGSKPQIKKVSRKPSYQVPLWAFLLLGLITLLSTSALAFIVGQGFPENSLVLPNSRQAEQQMLEGQ